MTDQPSAKSKLRHWRWWLTLALAILVLVGWCWWQLPRTMRLVARVPVDDAGVITGLDGGSGEPDYFAAHGMLLRAGSAGVSPASGLRLTLLGWDGVPRWQVDTPLHSPTELEYNPFNSSPYARVALSPDGKFLALVQQQHGKLRVMSWREGKPFGEAEIPWSSQLTLLAHRPTVTGDGRIWLADMQAQPGMLWAIDGKKVASGFLPQSLLPRWGSYAFLALPGETTFCAQTGFLLLDPVARLQVRGKQVIVTPVLKAPAPMPVVRTPLATSWFGLLEKGFEGTLDGRCRVTTAPGQTWELPVCAQVDTGDFTPDGRAALVLEYGLIRHGFQRTLAGLPLLDRVYTPNMPPHLVVYTRAGHRAAICPLRPTLDWPPGTGAIFPRDAVLAREHYTVEKCRLSPDSHHVAVLVRDDTGRHEVWYYRW